MPVKLSGEYWNTQSVPGRSAAMSRISFAPLTAISRMPARSRPNTTRRCVVDVELYRWTIARFAPSSASNVRRISGSRDCVSTCTVTSSGMRRSSISLRMKSKSVCDAAGNPTSISL